MSRWRMEECWLDSFLNCPGGGGGGREGVNTSIPKQTNIPVICQDARARVCVCLSVYVGCPEFHSPPLDPYILDTCDLFVLLCHMLRMFSISVKFLSLLYIHARFQRGRGADPWEITILKGSLAILVRSPLKLAKLRNQHLMLGHNRPASETPFQWRNHCRADNSPPSRQTFLDPRMTF